jgi:hypothetical protein
LKSEKRKALLVCWCYDRGPARLGRGGRRFALKSAVRGLMTRLFAGMRSAGRRGVERLKRGLRSSK